MKLLKKLANTCEHLCVNVHNWSVTVGIGRQTFLTKKRGQSPPPPPRQNVDFLHGARGVVYIVYFVLCAHRYKEKGEL